MPEWGQARPVTQPAGCQSAFTAMWPGSRHPQKSVECRLWRHTDLQLECGVATYCVILGKSADLSEPQVPQLSNERNKSFSFKDSQYAFCSARQAAWWVMTFPTGTRGVGGTEVAQRHGLKTIPEAQKRAASSSPVPSLPHLLNILSKTHPTAHQRERHRVWAMNSVHPPYLVCWANFTPTCLSILTPPDWVSLFHCRIVGLSHKVFTGYVKYNHSFMNKN